MTTTAANRSGTESKALSAALAAPAFVPKLTASSSLVADRHISRYASEQPANARVMGTLRFADRLIAPHFAAANSIGRMIGGYQDGLRERSVASGNWLFPRPWYQDELRWLAAQQQQTEDGEWVSANSSRVRSPVPTLSQHAPAMTTLQRAMMASASAPSMFGSPVDVWTPSHGPAANKVREHASVVRAVPAQLTQLSQPTRLDGQGLGALSTRAEAFAPVRQAAVSMQQALAVVAERAQLGGVSLLAADSTLAQSAPSLVAMRLPKTESSHSVGQRGQSVDTQAPAPALTGHAFSRRVEEFAQSMNSARERVASLTMPAPTEEVAAAQQVVPPATSLEQVAPAAIDAPSGRQSLARAMARAHVAAVAPAEPSAPYGAASGVASRPTVAPSDATSPDATAISMAAHQVAVEQFRFAQLIAADDKGQNFAPSAAPPMAMTAGLATLAGSPSHAIGAAPNPSPISTRVTVGSPLAALAAVSAASPAALNTLRFADRWLGKFAGRTTEELAGFEPVTFAGQLRSLDMLAPETTLVSPHRAKPPMATQGGAVEELVASQRSSEATAGPSAMPSGSVVPASTVRYDDDEETPDDVFAAIASAAASARSGVKPAVAAVPPKATPQGLATDGVGAAGVDLVSGRPLPPIVVPSAGIAPALHASPFSAELSAIAPGTTQSASHAVFDVRALDPMRMALSVLASSASGNEMARASVPSVSVVAPSMPVVASGGQPAAAATTLANANEWGDQSLLTSLAGIRDGSQVHTAAAVAPRVSGRLGALGRTLSDWSTAQYMSSADLALDFVAPETLAAAGVYGLTPQHALVATRLSAAGQQSIADFASSVDMSLVAAVAGHMGHGHTQQDASPAQRDDLELGVSPVMAANETVSSTWSAPAVTRPTAAASSALPVELASMLGDASEPMRYPRGAYLIPSGLANGLTLETMNEPARLSIAALEVLAASAVAERAFVANRSSKVAMRASSPEAAAQVDAVGGATDVGQPANSSLGQGQGPTQVMGTTFNYAERAMASLPVAQRELFEALFVRAAGSPAARAAQALAVAQRAAAPNTTAEERAFSAWQVMPMLLASEMDEVAGASAGGSDNAARDQRPSSGSSPMARNIDFQHATPLVGLAARAGEALGALVSPTQSTAPAGAAPTAQGALLRAPTAAPEVVRTGGKAFEADVPEWFEKAARKMFGEKTNTAADDISLADLTFIQTAAPAQVAASTRGEDEPRASERKLTQAKAGQENDDEIFDIDRIARDVYKEVMRLFQSAQARNGDPFL